MNGLNAVLRRDVFLTNVVIANILGREGFGEFG